MVRDLGTSASRGVECVASRLLLTTHNASNVGEADLSYRCLMEFLPIEGDVHVAVPATREQITPYVLFEQGDWFEDEIRFVRKLARPGLLAVDIGANHGVYALTLAKFAGPSGEVWAFEPASSTLGYLRKSVEKNALNNLHVIACGLSNRVGSASFFIGDNSELNSLHEGPGLTRGETIALRTVDACAAEFGWNDIDFVKLDAEGEEERIIEGGINFFRTQSPLIMFELKHGEQVNLGLIERFSALGYDPYRLVPGLNVIAPFDVDQPADPYQLNLFACKSDRADELEARSLLARSQAVEAIEPSSYDALCEAVAKRPFAHPFVAKWNHAAHPGEADYLAALTHYLASEDESLSVTSRLAHLGEALVKLDASLVESENASRLQLLVRAASAIGMRKLAVDVLGALLQCITSDRVIVNEPFLPLMRRFDAIDPGPRIAEWFIAQVLEQRQRLSAHSTYFTGRDVQNELEILQGTGFQSEEMNRRLELVRASRR